MSGVTEIQVEGATIRPRDGITPPVIYEYGIAPGLLTAHIVMQLRPPPDPTNMSNLVQSQVVMGWDQNQLNGRLISALISEYKLSQEDAQAIVPDQIVVLGSGGAGVSSWNARVGDVAMQASDVTAALTFTPYDAANPASYVNILQARTGVPNGMDAQAGQVGEFMSVQRLSTAATAAPTGADTAVTSLSLTAGDWDVWGSAGFTMTNCTGITLRGWLNAGGTTSPPVDQVGGNAMAGPANNTTQLIMPITPMRVLTAAAVIVTLGVTPTYGGPSPTCAVWGKILARRCR